MIFIIDDDPEMAKCIGRATDSEYKIFSNAISAMNEINRHLPDLIFLDILLNGPDGFTFLNELVSYSDTAKIPIVIVSSLDLKNQNFSEYNVIGVLNKDTMLPEEIKTYAKEYSR